MKLILKIVILAAAFMILLKSCGPFPGGRNALVGQPAPDFTLETLKGQTISMAQARNGRPAMIFFWATWCPHCRTQLRELALHRGRIETNGIAMVLVDVGEKPREVRNFVHANHIPFDVFLDRDAATAREYRIVGVPTFFFVNAEGSIVAAEHFLPENYGEILLR